MNTESESETKKSSRRSAIGGFLILTGVAAGGVVFNRAVIQPKREESRQAKEEKKAREKALKLAREKVNGHLDDSDHTTAGHIETRLKDIEAFFDKAAGGAPAFSKEMLGWGSKWKLIKDKARFWREETEHKAFVEEQFTKHVFKSEDLETTLRKAVEDFVARDGAAVNNEFLTKVRDDVPIELLDSEMNPDRFKNETRKSIEENFNSSARKVYGDIGGGAAAFVGVSIASAISANVLVRVATSIATKMGISAGILGAGAVASPWTLGAALVAALVIDLALGWAIDYFTDPEGDLAETIRTELATLQNLIIDGLPATETEEAVVGVRQELQTIAELQSRSRRDAIEVILDPSTT